MADDSGADADWKPSDSEQDTSDGEEESPPRGQGVVRSEDDIAPLGERGDTSGDSGAGGGDVIGEKDKRRKGGLVNAGRANRHFYAFSRKSKS